MNLCPAPRSTPRPTLEQIMGKVDALRRQCLARLPEAVPALAVEGRRLETGLYLTEHRFPLWYLAHRRHAPVTKAPPSPTLPLAAAEGTLTLLALLPAEMDDGSQRLFIAGTARLDEGQWLLRQAYAACAGSEAGLLAWLDGELAGCGALMPANGASRTLLLQARQRHGQSLPTTCPPRGGRAPAPPERLAWRTLDGQAARRALAANRQALLSVAGRLAQSIVELP